MRTARRASQAARSLAEARISDTDPAWMAAMNAPYDDTPDTEQELADLEEAETDGAFVSNAEVRRALAAQRPR